jgi:hypothetical protein
MPNHHSHSSINSNQYTAKQLDPIMRQKIAISALTSNENISQISRQYDTSRKFVYAQKEKASDALNEVFSGEADDSKVLFYIPVTKEWLQQSAMSLILSCHSSYGGVIEFFRDIFDFNICKGTIFNIMEGALDKAKNINNSQDLSLIKVGAHDEIFQKQTPVLVGCDVQSTYVYLLKQEEHRDQITWGVHLLDLSEQGMKLDYSIADAGKGLRSGQELAWPNIPCRGDVFHPLYDIGKLTTFLENRAKSALKVVKQLEQKKKKAKKSLKHLRRLVSAKKEAKMAEQLAKDIIILSQWLKNDILSVTGPDFPSRQELLKFVAAELETREIYCPHRIKPVRRLLELQGEDLLAFVKDIDLELGQLAISHGVDIYLVRQVFQLQGISTKTSNYWEKTEMFRHKIGGRFYQLQKDLEQLIKGTVRASSIVENLNSRLRSYFFLRKTLGPNYLELLQFYLNHKRYMRSSRPERKGKSPKELLTSQTHKHWLECLGYKLFKKSEAPVSAKFTIKQAA